MATAQTLPEGLDSSSGVEFVRLCAQTISKKASEGDLSYTTCLKEVAQHCNPTCNATSYRHCQHEAIIALPFLAKYAATSADDSARTAAFEAIAAVCFDLRDNAAASAVASLGNGGAMELLVPALQEELRLCWCPKPPPERMAACWCLMSLTRLEGVLGALLPVVHWLLESLLDEARHRYVGMPVLEAALTVLGSFAGHVDGMKQIAKVMVETRVSAAELLTALEPLVAADLGNLLTVGLLAASLLPAGKVEGAGPCEATLAHGFADILREFEATRGFFGHFHEAFTAALKGLEWPAGSNRFPQVARMVRSCDALAEGGFARFLIPAVPLLMDAVECGEAEAEGLRALLVLAEFPAAFHDIESRPTFLQGLPDTDEAQELQEYVERTSKTLTIWVSGASDLSCAVRLLHTECGHYEGEVDWREGAHVTAQDGDAAALRGVRLVEGWERGSAELLPPRCRAAWLWASETLDPVVGVCFAALRRAALERRRRLTVLSGDVGSLSAELPALRKGSTVASGFGMLPVLARLWGRSDLCGHAPPGLRVVQEEEEANTKAVSVWLQWFEDFRMLVLRDLVLPQATHMEKADVEEEAEVGLIHLAVQRARREAEELVIELDAHLAQAKRGYLCCGRLTIADIAAAAVLQGVGSMFGQNWARYPTVDQYLSKLSSVRGFSEAFVPHADCAKAVARMVRSTGTPVTI